MQDHFQMPLCDLPPRPCSFLVVLLLWAEEESGNMSEGFSSSVGTCLLRASTSKLAPNSSICAARWQIPNPIDPSQTLGQAILANGGYRQSRHWVYWSFLITIGYLTLLIALTAVAYKILKRASRLLLPSVLPLTLCLRV